jgi:prepilin-type N-terminal cleavage/methylation domain-containing protein
LEAVHRGYSLAEVAIVLVVVGLGTALGLPGWRGLLDRIAVERAASEVTTALSIARNVAVLRATRARLTIAADSLRVDEWGKDAWMVSWRWAGPEYQAVSLTVSNNTVIFGPTGIGWGTSNTAVVLRRGTKTARITTSRVGRVKRW